MATTTTAVADATETQRWRIRRAAMALTWMLPQFGPAWASIALVVAEAYKGCRVETAALFYDTMTVVFSPTFAAGRSDGDLRFIVAHELCHGVYLHGLRRPEAGAQWGQMSPAELAWRWNVACDRAINGILQRAGLDVPADALMPLPGLDKATAEELFLAELPQVAPPPPPPPPDAGEAGDGDDEAGDDEAGQGGDDRADDGDDQADGGGAADGDDQTDGDEAGQGDGQGDDGQGAGQGGDEGDDEGQGAGPGGQGAARNPGDHAAPGQGCGPRMTPGADAAQAEDAPRLWGEVRGQMDVAARGTEAGGKLGDLFELPPQRVGWAQLLRGTAQAVLAAHGRDDYSFARRSRRSPARGVQLPGTIALRPRLAVVIDTSGSMGADAVALAVGTVGDIARECHVDVFVVLHTVGVYYADWIRERDDAAAKLPHQSGGTAFDAAYAAVGDEGGRFDAVVHLTDGEIWGTWPELPANARRLVVGLVGTRCQRDVPDWASDVIDCEQL